MNNLEKLRAYAVTINNACKTIQQYGKDSPQGRQATETILTYRQNFTSALEAFTGSEG